MSTVRTCVRQVAGSLSNSPHRALLTRHPHDPLLSCADPLDVPPLSVSQPSLFAQHGVLPVTHCAEASLLLQRAHSRFDTRARRRTLLVQRCSEVYKSKTHRVNCRWQCLRRWLAESSLTSASSKSAKFLHRAPVLFSARGRGAPARAPMGGGRASSVAAKFTNLTDNSAWAVHRAARKAGYQDE